MPLLRRILFKIAFFSIFLSGACAKTLSESASSSVSNSNLADQTQLFQAAGNNVVVAALADGLVIVDGGSIVDADQLLQAIEKSKAIKLTKKQVQALFNTHWHADRIGLNLYLGKKDIPIIAHENTRQWLEQPHYNVWNNETISASPPHALPSKTFYLQDKLILADEIVEYAYLPQAHSDGDIYVYFKNRNVLAIGGVLRVDQWPELDWSSAGWFGGMLDALETLLAIANDETVIVPAHGPTLNKAQLQKEYEMYLILFDRIFTLLKQSKSPAEAVAELPAREFHPEWGNADRFVESAFRSLYGHLRGEKRMGVMP